jgi:nicotinamide-nucleotide amidase
MDAEIISIGDELTSGQRLDTNSQWLSQQLGELGIRVLYHTTVADCLEANVEVFRLASERADLVICTGGLGPTADDLTRQALADAMQLELVQDAAAMQHIKQLFRRRGRPMPESNNIQSMFPAGSQVVPNPHGSAPGIDLAVQTHNDNNCRIIALPGVPAEMKEMWEQTVRPAIQAMLPDNNQMICHYRLKCFGVGESDLEQMLPDLVRRGRQPSVGITVSKATITLRISAAGENEDACRAIMQPTIETIHECLGELVFGVDNDELQHVVARSLAARGQTLCSIEWGTGGILAGWLAELEPHTGVFLGGHLLTSWQSLSSLIGWTVDPQQVEHDQAEMTAMAAAAARSFTGSDYVLAIGPVVGEQDEQDNRQIDIVLAGPDLQLQQRVAYRGHPDILQARAAKQALDILRKQLNQDA